MSSRILLCKYVPDLSRMEPRNIGVMVWSRGEIAAKFLDADKASFVSERGTYARWTKFWTDLISVDEIVPRRGRPISKSCPECMDAVLTTQEGNYIVVDAGELLERVKKRDLANAASFLFDELVAAKTRPIDEAALSLKIQCERVFKNTGIFSLGDFRTKISVPCMLYGQPRTFRFNYGIGLPTPTALFQRVDVTKDLSVNVTAMTFREISKEQIVERDRCAALVCHEASATARDNIALLRNACRVIEVDRSGAEHELREMCPHVA